MIRLLLLLMVLSACASTQKDFSPKPAERDALGHETPAHEATHTVQQDDD